MKEGVKNFARVILIPLVFTFAAFAFWLKYSAGQNYWWISSVALILAGHYYFYYKKARIAKKLSPATNPPNFCT